MFYYTFNTIIGKITLLADETSLKMLSFGEKRPSGAVLGKNKIISDTISELEEYFLGTRIEFDIPVSPEGTDFQKKVWKALLHIPYGETRSYKAIAEYIGNPKACRAVGGANNKNPIAIIIPCHRVIGKNGSLTGYAGGTDIKSALLEMEKKKTPV